jgi:hypothetical protein
VRLTRCYTPGPFTVESRSVIHPPSRRHGGPGRLLLRSRRAYRCLLIDAPTQSIAGTDVRPQHYRRMADLDIAALPVSDLLHRDGGWIFLLGHVAQTLCTSRIANAAFSRPCCARLGRQIFRSSLCEDDPETEEALNIAFDALRRCEIASSPRRFCGVVKPIPTCRSVSQLMIRVAAFAFVLIHSREKP